VNSIRHLFVTDTRSNKTSCLTRDFEGEITRYLWVTQDLLAFQAWNPKSRKSEVYRVDLLSKKPICLAENDTHEVKFLNTPEKREGTVFLLINDGPQKSWQPYSLDLKTGDRKQLAENSGKIEGWILDHGGKCRVAIHEKGAITRVLFRGNTSKTFQLMLSFDNVNDLFQPLFFSSDNRYIYAYSNMGRDRVALVEFDPLEKREVNVMYEDPVYDLFGDDETDYVRYSLRQNQLAFVFYTTWKRTYHCFSRHYEKLIATLKNRFGRKVIHLISSTRDENTHIVKVSSDRIRGIYYLFNLGKNKLIKLENSYPWLKESDMAFKKPLRFRSRDGQDIHGYLTFPPGKNPKNLPLVVVPHGGPRWRDCWEMGRFTEIQLFANRGYAVLQINFRGSSGYGKSFTHAGFKQNGLKVQNDITDGILYLIKKSIVDKKRVAILGGSYGGYAVLAGLTFTPDLYACGVDLFGVSNFFTFLNSIPPWFNKDSIYRTVGHPEKDRELLEKTSPLFHVDKIRVPVLIAQGGKDPVVKRVESDQMVEALKKRGIPVQYIFKEDEGHGYFKNKKYRLELWHAIDQFLKKHLSE